MPFGGSLVLGTGERGVEKSADVLGPLISPSDPSNTFAPPHEEHSRDNIAVREGNNWKTTRSINISRSGSSLLL